MLLVHPSHSPGHDDEDGGGQIDVQEVWRNTARQVNGQAVHGVVTWGGKIETLIANHEHNHLHSLHYSTLSYLDQ